MTARGAGEEPVQAVKKPGRETRAPSMFLELPGRYPTVTLPHMPVHCLPSKLEWKRQRYL